jgi:hypothetical protein
MRIGGVSSARIYTPVHIPQSVGKDGELQSPARTDMRTDDIPVQVDRQEAPNWIPAHPDLDMFANVAAVSSGAGAGGQSRQRGQGQGRKPPENTTSVPTDGSVDEAGVSQQPQGALGRFLGGARRLLGL